MSGAAAGVAARSGPSVPAARSKKRSSSTGNGMTSVLFFSDATTYAGTWLFVVGSFELLIRPVIRLTRQVHLQRLPGRPGAAPESGHDF